MRFFNTLALGLLFFIESVFGFELVDDQHVHLVSGHCGACHSLAIVAQNRMSKDDWLKTIRWMQETQGLWPLGDHEPLILDYLSKHYGPIAVGRRAPLPAHLMPAD